MIKRGDLLDEFEKEQIRQNRADYLENLKIAGALYREAVTLGILPLKNPLEGIEVKIRLAKALHALPIPGEDDVNDRP